MKTMLSQPGMKVRLRVAAGLPFNVPKSCIRLLSPGSADVQVIGYIQEGHTWNTSPSSALHI
jgi:hypothetical protein